MNLNNVFIQVLVLFTLILVGYVARKKDFMDEEFTSKLSKLTMTIFLPSMIISSMQLEYNSHMIGKITNLILISLIMYTISFTIAYLIKFIFKSKENLGIYQFVILFSNVGFMGYPVVEAVLGKEAIFFTSIFNLPFNLLVMTIGAFLLAKDNDSYTFSLKSIISPVIIAVILGLILFIFSIKLPLFLNRPLELLGNVTTPVSMLIIGSMLCNSSAFDCFFNKKLYFITFIRLVLLPTIIYFMLKGIVRDDMLLAIPVVISAMPAAANTAILANEYNANESLASQAVFFTTLFSIVTIPLISGILLV
ncbi:AEC family transporter [Romboutsia sp.]|uniref:AEC family transporter n=1 Tax=Romboutsia sp. TaxID=1965302 RepID=UPI003F3214FB